MNFYRNLIGDYGRFGGTAILSGLCGGAIGGIWGFSNGYNSYLKEKENEKSVFNVINFSAFCIYGTGLGMINGAFVGAFAPITIPTMFFEGYLDQRSFK